MVYVSVIIDLVDISAYLIIIVRATDTALLLHVKRIAIVYGMRNVTEDFADFLPARIRKVNEIYKSF